MAKLFSVNALVTVYPLPGCSQFRPLSTVSCGTLQGVAEWRPVCLVCQGSGSEVREIAITAAALKGNWDPYAVQS